MLTDELINQLPPALHSRVCQHEPMSRHTTLRVGGPADLFLDVSDLDELAEVSRLLQSTNCPHFLLGEGSNICVSDAGIRGLVLKNSCKSAKIGTLTRADAGHNFMRGEIIVEDRGPQP